MSSVATRAQKVLGVAEFDSEISNLKAAGWTVDAEKNQLRKNYKFKDFNQVNSHLDFESASFAGQKGFLYYMWSEVVLNSSTK